MVRPLASSACRVFPPASPQVPGGRARKVARGEDMATVAAKAAAAARICGRQGRTTRRVVARAEDVAARRSRESARVEERAKSVSTRAELDAALALAKDRLVILEVFADDECDLGENAGDAPVWNDAAGAHDAMLEPCRRLSSTIARVARDADEVDFILLDRDESAETKAIASELGARLMPTVQFWKSGELVYQVDGASGAGQAVAEGSMYYGDAMAGGAHVTDIVEEIHTKAELDDWMARCSLPGTGPRGVEIDVPCDKQIGVLDVSLGKNSPECMHAFPAVVALAKNTAGAVRWARMLGDMSDETKAIMDQLNVSKAPTFIFYLDGKEVGRYQGSDRVQIMSAVIEIQRQNGIRMPKPPPRKQMTIAEATRIAQEKRKAAEEAGARLRGW